MIRVALTLFTVMLTAGCAGDAGRQDTARSAMVAVGASSRGDLGAPAPVRAAPLQFMDSRTFDGDLSRAMREEAPEIVVDVPVGFNLNRIPERVDRWLLAVKENGGPVVAEPEEKRRGMVSALIDVVLAVVRGIDDRRTYSPSERYGATLIYRPDGTVSRMVFRHRSLAAFDLVTAEEGDRDRSRASVGTTRSIGSAGGRGGPDIVLVRPAPNDGISSPVDIELRFRSSDLAKVDLRTLKVRYGSFGLDVTDRLLVHAVVTESGIIARGARLPAGSHAITVELADTRRRVTQQTFRMVVGSSAD